jgi:hypothetical protein
MVNKSPEIPDNARAIGAVARAISSVGEEFESIKYKVEGIAESIGKLGSFSELAKVLALSSIAAHGSSGDQEAALEKLKRGYLQDES